jgi:hypothetical protein
MKQVSESYVKLALAVGKHDGDYVDAYYGPAEWKAEADSTTIPLPEIEQRANALLTQLGTPITAQIGEGPGADTSEVTLLRLRAAYLQKQLDAMVARVRMLQGNKLSFDDEARSLYDVSPPTNTEQHFQNVVARLDKALPGSGPVSARYVSYRSRFSPQSLIAEGSANYGIDIAFPGEDSTVYERTTLFPLAGLPPDEADAYYRIQDLVRELSYAGNEAARRYLNGEIDAAAAAAWLERYALVSPAVAKQRVGFIDKYRSYVINYNLGQDLVRQYVERTAGPNATADTRWKVFSALLASPRLPSGLQ